MRVTLVKGNEAECNYAGRHYQQISELLIDYCVCLEDAGGYVLKFELNTEYKWEFSVYPELCILLESLTDLAKFLRRETNECIVDFYEQGMEFCLRFLYTEDEIVSLYFEPYYGKSLIVDMIKFEDILHVITLFSEDIRDSMRRLFGGGNLVLNNWINEISLT